MIFADTFAEFFRRDQVPDEGLDLLVTFVGVDAVEEGHPEGIFNVLRREALAEVSVMDHLFPTAPAVK